MKLISPLQTSHHARIVAIRNDSGLQLAIDAGTSPDQVIVAETPGQAIAMVENGTADVWSYGEMAGRRMISKYAQNPGLFAPFMEIATVDEYLAFHPDTDPAFVATVNETIREMRQNRAIEGVSEYVRFSTGISRLSVMRLISPRRWSPI